VAAYPSSTQVLLQSRAVNCPSNSNCSDSPSQNPPTDCLRCSHISLLIPTYQRPDPVMLLLDCGLDGKKGPREQKERPSPRQARFVSPRECRFPHALLPAFPQPRQTQQTHNCTTSTFESVLSTTRPRTRKSKIKTHTMSNLPRSQPSNSRLSTVPSQKPRQLSHLQAQLAQLTANMSDLESLMRMTAGQAQDMRGLGGYAGAM
jgi:hypothetical protein